MGERRFPPVDQPQRLLDLHSFDRHLDQLARLDLFLHGEARRMAMPAFKRTNSLMVSSVASSIQMLSGVLCRAKSSKMRVREGVLTLWATNCSLPRS